MSTRGSSKSAAHQFLESLGIKHAPELVKLELQFSAPKQGDYQPPHYELVIDSSKPEWCTYRNYNAAPRPIAPSEVMVPVEMTRFTVLTVSKGVDRAKVEAWARSLLTHD
jgi:hypothetical protein